MANHNKALLIISPCGKYGGAEKRYLNLFNYILKKNKEFFLIINKTLFEVFSMNNFFFNKQNIIIISIPFIDRNPKNKTYKYDADINIKIYSNTSFYKQVKSHIKKIIIWILFLIKTFIIIKKYNIKYFYSFWIGGIWGWFIKKIIPVSFAYGYMDASFLSLNPKPINFITQEYFALRNADIIDCLSPNIEKGLKEKINFRKNQIIITTPNSFVDYEKFYPVYPKKNTIVFLSRLTQIKNPILFLESLLLIKDLIIETKYEAYIIGDGPTVPDILEFIKKNNLKNISYKNSTFYPENFLRNSKIFLSLQEDDNYPSQSLLEAMACENIVIATNVGSTNLLVNEETGILVKKDADEIALSLKNIIRNEEQYLHLTKNARIKVITEHTIEKYYQYFINLPNKIQ